VSNGRRHWILPVQSEQDDSAAEFSTEDEILTKAQERLECAEAIRKVAVKFIGTKRQWQMLNNGPEVSTLSLSFPAFAMITAAERVGASANYRQVTGRADIAFDELILHRAFF
jgi:hypothetical protein